MNNNNEEKIDIDNTNKSRKRTRLFVALIVVGVLVLFAVLSLLIPYLLVGRYASFMYTSETIQQVQNIPNVGIVFGGGIDGNNKPRDLLRERLDKAADMYDKGVIKKILVSGDNRFRNYNEPLAMATYLINERHIPEEVIQQDNAGRSTYETCERAQKIFALKRVILFSESTHLPRALYLCRHFDIDAYGIETDGAAIQQLRDSQMFRELFARTKAVYNIEINGEPTVLGDQIPIE
jgi:SanA protein